MIVGLAWFHYSRTDLVNRKAHRYGYLKNKNVRDVNIGVVWPFKDLPSYIQGIELALSEIEKEKSFSYRFKLHFKDEKLGETDIWDFANNKKIVAAIGFANSGSVKACAPILNEAGVLVLECGTNPFLLERNFQLTVGNNYSDFYHANNIKDIVKSLGMKKIAIIYKDTDYCNGMFTLFSFQIGKEKEFYYTSINEYNEKSFVEPIYDRIDNTESDGIVFIGYSEDASSLLKYLRKIGYRKPLIGNEELDTDAFIKSFDPSFDLSNVYCSSYDTTFDSRPELKAFAKRYKQKFNSAPDQWSLCGYSAIMLLKKSIANEGSLLPQSLYRSIIYSGHTILGLKYEYATNGLLKLNLTSSKKWMPGKGFIPFLTGKDSGNYEDSTFQFERQF
jgi:ABC-type branched-subunit amino acid transport system substrate-binding protein